MRLMGCVRPNLEHRSRVDFGTLHVAHAVQPIKKHDPSLFPVALNGAFRRAALRRDLVERVAAEVPEVDEFRETRIAGHQVACAPDKRTRSASSHSTLGISVGNCVMWNAPPRLSACRLRMESMIRLRMTRAAYPMKCSRSGNTASRPEMPRYASCSNVVGLIVAPALRRNCRSANCLSSAYSEANNC